ncbi:MAG: hypothetical protein FWE57_00240 [Chitinispirillia bacterium]|nr:hypothetical protein [Chitinispirillia bacterium]
MSIKINKKYTPIIVIILLLTSGIIAQTQNIIHITTIAGLQKIGTTGYPLNGVYELTGDIDASSTRSGAGFTPIGTAAAPFTGEFYAAQGRTFVISNLYINRPNSGIVGLFGVIGEDGIVRGIGVDNAEIIGHHTVGTIAGVNYGTVDGCFGSGTVKASRQESSAGGLVGVNGGIISNSHSYAVVDGRENVGGLVGFLTIAPKGEISQSYAVGSVNGTSRVGGLAGRVFGGTVSDCYAAGKVTAGNRGLAGGLIGDDFVLSAPSSTVWGKDANGDYITKASVNRSFWDIDVSEQRTSAGGMGRSTSQMRRRATFERWDFTSAWSISEGVSYPRLIVNREPLFWLVTYYAKNGGRLVVDGVLESDLHLYHQPVVHAAYAPQIEAAAQSGWRFVKWSDGSTANPRSGDFITDNKTVSAEFEEVKP